MEQHTERQLIETFTGAKGKAQLYEVAKTFPGRARVEEVKYEVIFSERSQFCLTLGEASILACELSGDPRFATEVTQTGHSNL